MKTIKLYKKLKKFGEGTANVTQSTGQEKFGNAMGYANTGLQIANMGNQMFGDQGNEFGVKDDGSAITGGVLSGASQGASLGSMAGPIGTAIGAGVGGLYGGIKAYQGNEEAKARQEEFEKQQRQLSIKESQNKWQQTLASGFKPQGNEFAQKYAKYGGLMKMGDGGKLKPAKVYTDKAEFLKAKEAYNDSLYLHNRSNSIIKELEKQGFNKSEKSSVKEAFDEDSMKQWKESTDFIPKDKRYYENRDSTRTILTGTNDKFKGVNTEKEIPFVSKMMFHKNILPDSIQTMSYKDPYTYKGGKQTHETLEEWKTNSGKEVEGSRRIAKDLKTLSDTSTISYNTEEDALLYKKPNQPVKFVPDIPLPIRQTLMKPPTKKVERAPGLGGFNRIMQNGGELVPNKQAKTKLSSGQQIAYDKWKSDNKYNESDDYDLAGYWKEEGMKNLQFPNLSPKEKIREVESNTYPELDKFYKENPHVAGMNHTRGEVSKNPYSKLPNKNLNAVLDLEKMRDIMSNDSNSPKPNYKITKNQNEFLKDNSEGKAYYANASKQIRRETIASRNYVGDDMGNAKYTKEQTEYVNKLAEYANKKPYHLPDKFKRLAPFGNGDGYQQLSDESNVASQFDKRGQGFWVGDKFIAYKNGGHVQQLSKDAVEFKGNSHEMGGIKEPVVNGRVLEGAEVENAETMQGNFIFSEELGFAQRHKPLAKMLGKLEKKAETNPNDKINNSTIARVNSRIESLKKEQEETKEALGIENDSQEMKNGGLYKKMRGGGKYVNDGTNQSYTDASGTYAITGKNNTLRYKGLRDKDFRTINDPNGIAAINKLSPSFQYTPNAVQAPSLKRMESSEALGEFSNYQKPLTDLGKENVDDTTMMLPEGSKTKVNWGNVASGLAPYAGVAANYMVNEQAKKLRLPQEKLTTPISLQRVNYDNQRVESDIQRNQLNKLTSRNLTNSAVASAVMAKNLGTTIREKNAINTEEMNTNRMISNEEVGKNKEIERLNNRTQVDNEDRFYNRDRDYLQNKGQIATNLSSMVQRQRADRMQYDLEDRKIEALSKADANRGVWDANFADDQEKANSTYALTSKEKEKKKRGNSYEPKEYGGKVKSSLRKKMNC